MINCFHFFKGNALLPGITVAECQSISDVMDCLEKGLLIKHSTTSKGFNLNSCHTIFNITLEHSWSEQGIYLN